MGEPARAEAVKDGRVSATEGPILDGFEHDGTLGRVGMTKSRGARNMVHEEIAPHPSIRWGEKPRTMMQ
jgi:hypothetical protein